MLPGRVSQFIYSRAGGRYLLTHVGLSHGCTILQLTKTYIDVSKYTVAIGEHSVSTTLRFWVFAYTYFTHMHLPPSDVGPRQQPTPLPPDRCESHRVIIEHTGLCFCAAGQTPSSHPASKPPGVMIGVQGSEHSLTWPPLSGLNLVETGRGLGVTAPQP